MAQKKIILEFLGKSGAGVVFTLEMAKALKNAGMDVWVVLSDKILNKHKWEEIRDTKDIHVEFIETGNKKIFLKATLKFLIKRKSVLRNIKNIEFDYAVRTFPHPWLEFLERAVKAKRVFYILHDPTPHSGTELFRKIISRRNVETADDIIVLSKQFIKPTMERFKLPIKKIHYMKHGLLPVYPDSEELCNINTEEFNKYKMVFLFFGRIDKYKGLHILFDAFGSLKQKYSSQIALIIAGSGEFQEYEKEFSLLEDAYIYNRYINDTELNKLFSLQNVVVVLPYLDATQSGVITVAAEFMTPIIASDSGALREQLNQGTVGVFFKPGNANELKQCMETMLNNENFRLEKKKMKNFRESLDWNIIIKKFFSSLERIG